MKGMNNRHERSSSSGWTLFLVLLCLSTSLFASSVGAVALCFHTDEAAMCLPDAVTIADEGCCSHGTEASLAESGHNCIDLTLKGLDLDFLILRGHFDAQVAAMPTLSLRSVELPRRDEKPLIVNRSSRAPPIMDTVHSSIASTVLRL